MWCLNTRVCWQNTGLWFTHLVVVHDLGLVVLRSDGVDDVHGAVRVQRRLLEEPPLQDVRAAVRGHVRPLKPTEALVRQASNKASHPRISGEQPLGRCRVPTYDFSWQSRFM